MKHLKGWLYGFVDSAVVPLGEAFQELGSRDHSEDHHFQDNFSSLLPSSFSRLRRTLRQERKAVSAPEKNADTSNRIKNTYHFQPEGRDINH